MTPPRRNGSAPAAPRRPSDAAQQTCPCGSGREYAACCGRYLDDIGQPATAEALMRSRYTAFCLGRAGYLLDSWHPSTRPAQLDLTDDRSVQWLGLKIVDRKAGGPQDSEGTVEFVARRRHNGKAYRLHEVSRFVRENGRWYYLDGEID